MEGRVILDYAQHKIHFVEGAAFADGVEFPQMTTGRQNLEFVTTLDEIFHIIKGDTFSVVEGKEGYHKVCMSNKSRDLNALRAIGVTMTCAGMMEGMKNASNHYQKCSDKMLSSPTGIGSALGNWASGYIDDTIVYQTGWTTTPNI
jgi:hypothetical protein